MLRGKYGEKLNMPLFQKFRNKNIFISGHTGFIGSWLTLWLHNLGANVIGYSKNVPTKPSLFEKLEIKKEIDHNFGDINDLTYMKKLVKKSKAEFIFHLAAQPIVLTSYEKPLETFQTNVIGTANLLESLRMSSDCKAAIIVTSDKCYENSEKIHFFKENDPLGGTEPYSSSKAAAEIITSSYKPSFFKKEKEIGIATVREVNFIGGGDWSKYRIVPDSVRSLTSKKSIIIRNPNSIRPFQFVLEPISAMLQLAVLLEKKPSTYSGSWNVGPNSKKIVNVRSFVKEIIKNWGYGNYILNKQKKHQEAGVLLLNSNKIKKELGWYSAYSTQEAIQETINWYKYDLMNKNIREFSTKQIDNYFLKAKNKKIQWTQ